MKSVASKILFFSTFLIFFVACDITVDPSGQVYNSGVYEFIYGEANIPEMQTYDSAWVVMTRTSESKPQSWNEVQVTTKATVSSTAAGAIAIPPVVTSQRALGNEATVGTSVEHRYSPSLYLPNMEETLRQREYGELRPSTKAAQYPRNMFQVGDTWQGVNLLYPSAGALGTTEAQCVYISNHAYFMVDTKITTPIEPDLIRTYAEEFDKNYALMHDNFATEADIDGNGKVIIMIYLFGEDNVVGYFSPSDKIENAAKSNFADIFYINYKFASAVEEANQTSSTLVHEFQHMIFFDNIKTSTAEMMKNATWFNEAMSMLAEFVCGYYVDGASAEIMSFRNIYPTLSLTNWTDANYGASLLFGVYLYENFGKSAINALYKQSVAGIPAIERVTWQDFNTTFLDFTTALAISNRGYSGERKHNFAGIDFRRYVGGEDYNLPPATTVAPGGGYTTKVPYYGFSTAVFSGRVSQIKIGRLFDGVVFLQK